MALCLAPGSGPTHHLLQKTLPLSFQVRGKIEAGAVPVAKYLIRKQLTMRPEDYPDAAMQPHVQVCHVGLWQQS